MFDIIPFCVFCQKRTSKLKSFSEETLWKCSEILCIRKENNLVGKYVILPNEINDFQLYHSDCYRRFTALPPKHRVSKAATSPSTSQQMRPDDLVQVFADKYLENISDAFRTLYTEEQLSDVTIHCKEGSVKAHKLILAASSPYFCKVFRENRNEYPIIILHGITLTQLENLMDLLYRGIVDVPSNNLETITSLVREFEIKGVVVGERESDNVRLELNQNSQTVSPESAHNRDTRFKGQKRVAVDFVYEEDRPQSRPTSTSSLQSNDIRLPKKSGQGDLPTSAPIIVKREVSSPMSYSDSSLHSLRDNLTISEPKPVFEHVSPKLNAWARKQRKFKCNLCPSSFKRSSHLTRHQLVHTGERPYSCNQCDKAFSRHDKLKHHVRKAHEFIPDSMYERIDAGEINEDSDTESSNRHYSSPLQNGNILNEPSTSNTEFSRASSPNNYERTNSPLFTISHITSILEDSFVIPPKKGRGRPRKYPPANLPLHNKVQEPFQSDGTTENKIIQTWLSQGESRHEKNIMGQRKHRRREVDFLSKENMPYTGRLRARSKSLENNLGAVQSTFTTEKKTANFYDSVNVAAASETNVSRNLSPIVFCDVNQMSLATSTSKKRPSKKQQKMGSRKSTRIKIVEQRSKKTNSIKNKDSTSGNYSAVSITKSMKQKHTTAAIQATKAIKRPIGRPRKIPQSTSLNSELEKKCAYEVKLIERKNIILKSRKSFSEINGRKRKQSPSCDTSQQNTKFDDSMNSNLESLGSRTDVEESLLYTVSHISPIVNEEFEVPKKKRGRPKKKQPKMDFINAGVTEHKEFLKLKDFKCAPPQLIKRGRGRPRLNQVLYPSPGPGAQNYDITNLPYGDLNYLTSQTNNSISSVEENPVILEPLVEINTDQIEISKTTENPIKTVKEDNTGGSDFMEQAIIEPLVEIETQKIRVEKNDKSPKNYSEVNISEIETKIGLIGECTISVAN